MTDKTPGKTFNIVFEIEGGREIAAPALPGETLLDAALDNSINSIYNYV